MLRDTTLTDVQTLARHPARIVAALYLGFALLFFAAAATRGVARGRLIAGDALFYYAYLPSLVVDHDVDLTNDLETLRGSSPTPLKWSPTTTGKASSPFAVGSAILALPFFLIGLGADALFAGRSDGYGWFAQGSVCLAGMSYAALGTVLGIRLLRRWHDDAIALVASLATVLATPLVYYWLVSPAYAHAASFFAVTAFLSVWLAHREALAQRGALWLGLSAGVMTLVRWQDVLFVLVPAVALLARLARASASGAERRRVLAFIATTAVAAGIAFLPQMWVWHEIYGKWLTVPQGDTWVRWTRPDLLAALASLDAGGLFTWTPLTLVGILGLGMFRRAEPMLALGLALAFAAEIYVEGTVHHGLGSAYGCRRLIGATAIFAIGFATVLERVRTRRGWRAALAASALLVGWNGLLLTEYQWLAHRPGRHGPYPTLRELIQHTPFRG
ncbi:MAG: hypothetical protein U0610_09860 [bacterium]